MKLFYVVKTSPEPAQRNCLLTQKSAFDSMHVPMPRRLIKRPEHDRTEQIKFFFARCALARHSSCRDEKDLGLKRYVLC